MPEHTTTHLYKLITTYSGYIAIIVFGAVAHGVVQKKEAKEKGLVFTLIDFAIAAFIAAFSGVIFFLVGEAYLDSAKQVGALAGVGAFMGLSGINRVIDTVMGILEKRVK